MKLPDSKPFHLLHEAIAELDNVLHLSIDGIHRISQMLPIVSALDTYHRQYPPADYSEEEATRTLEATRARAKLAESEIARGFPVLHQHAVVALWGLLEAFVEDLAIAFLRTEPSLLQQECFANVRITLAEYEQLEPDERLRVLVREFNRQSKAETKQGVSGFEITLDAIKMAGSLPDKTRKSLHELGHVRNILVHRGGTADRRLVLACPWVRWKPGDKLQVSHGDYIGYRTAVEDYLVELLRRSLQFAGHSRAEAEVRIPEANRERSGGESQP